VAKKSNIWHNIANYYSFFKVMNKKCKKCGLFCVKKDGHMRLRQRYKCTDTKCGHVFQNSSRKKKDIVTELWNKYCFNKQTNKHTLNYLNYIVYPSRKYKHS